ncbi:hypothetical protein [Blastochloris sulfoviridis]|uniref:Uncharacterized protein n=1 Tax=Blastochloris sulfoviridis TaxID=50712 RepID=A0A5M6HQF9_9HYPH|nr:hypothetical protein [Blastochloris sulfoviridis]KAA5598112.1 hypothetical protein F1193_14145 [Blastochloris sulfoviridis]
MTARLARAGLLAAVVAATLPAAAGEDAEMRQRPPAERNSRTAGCIARVTQQYAPPADDRAAPERRTDGLRPAERLGAAVYARCGLPR